MVGKIPACFAPLAHLCGLLERDKVVNRPRPDDLAEALLSALCHLLTEAAAEAAVGWTGPRVGGGWGWWVVVVELRALGSPWPPPHT